VLKELKNMLCLCPPSQVLNTVDDADDDKMSYSDNDIMITKLDCAR